MRVVTLSIFDSEGQIGVEGFVDEQQAAAFTVEVLNRGLMYGEWRGLQCDSHHDMREVLQMLDTIDQQARFFVHLGYGRDAITKALADTFPTEDVEKAIQDAEAHYARCQQQLDDAVRAEGQSAVAAEHDLSKTMHEED